MTIIYQYKVASASFFGFFKLLKCWRGSVYKLMYKEMFVFCTLYGIISLVYRFALNQEQQKLFESIAKYCNSYTNLIPVSFVLGFYVSIVVHRWWQQFENVPWPDRTLFIMGSYLQGDDECSRIIRRTVARYMLFGEILILRSISVAVMKRYPSLDHIVDAGIVTSEETLMYERVECKYNKFWVPLVWANSVLGRGLVMVIFSAGIVTSEEALMYERVECKYNKFWVPLVWANSVLTSAKKEGKIESDMGFRLIMEQLADFRDKCSLCFVYDWITIPIVYTQVVTLACHTFFAACLIGRQYAVNEEGNLDLYIPVFTVLQFFFYMGWLKVAEQLINPFGEDDDDYDLNWLIDRHAAVAMCLVDQCHGAHPPLVKDSHFNEVVSDLPYTAASMASRRPNFLGSTYNLSRPSVADQRIISNKVLNEITVHGHRNAYKYYQNQRAPQGSIGSRTGSMLSLFGFKNNLQRNPLADSRDTLMSASTTANGYINMPNGGVASPSTVKRRNDSRQEEDGTYLPPEYVPLRRARASTDAAHKPLKRLIDSDRERKWSFPLSLIRRKVSDENRIPMSSKNSSVASLDTKIGGASEAAPLITPPVQGSRPRFVIEPVAGDTEADTKINRNRQIIDMHLANMASSSRPSRPSVLSAIEEGNTITSISEMMSSGGSSHSLELPSPTADNQPFEPIQEMAADEHDVYDDNDDVIVEHDDAKSVNSETHMC